jgi:hypothetical protein
VASCKVTSCKVASCKVAICKVASCNGIVLSDSTVGIVNILDILDFLMSKN